MVWRAALGFLFYPSRFFGPKTGIRISIIYLYINDLKYELRVDNIIYKFKNFSIYIYIYKI